MTPEQSDQLYYINPTIRYEIGFWDRVKTLERFMIVMKDGTLYERPDYAYGFDITDTEHKKFFDIILMKIKLHE